MWNALLNLAKIIGIISQERKDYLMSTASAQSVMDLKVGLTEADPSAQAIKNRTHKSP